MLKGIIAYPHKLLKTKSKEISIFDDTLHTLLDDMYETMLNRSGIGLAAIQVGTPLRVFILNTPNEEEEQHKENLMEVINPEILSKEGSTVYSEGCLSVPEFYEDVKRYDTIEVSYQNRYGEIIKTTLDGLDAIAFQHELDHLEGILFIDRLSLLKRKKFEKEWKKRLKNPKL